MLLFILFSLVHSNKRICICNGECKSQCSTNIFDPMSLNFPFNDKLLSLIQNEDEISLDFYSKQKDFIFTIDSSNFNEKKVTFRVINSSQMIKLRIKESLRQFFKTIELQSNDSIELSNVFPHKSINNHQKNLLDQISSMTVPLSIGLRHMNPTGSPTCAFLSGGDGPYDPSIGSQSYGCKKEDSDLTKEDAYKCGLRCYGSNQKFEYTFIGVRFAIYGKYDPGHGWYSIELDGKIISEVNQKNSERKNHILQYLSEILPYKEHTVKILPHQQTYEIYKLAYWPSVTAKRVNSTSFTKTGTFKRESDGIGGFREYSEGSGTATLSLNCTKFWLYGVKFDHLGDFTLSYNDVQKTIHQNGVRNEGVLLYESPELVHTSITLKLQSSGVLMIYCLYYEEPLIPMSVGLKFMQPQYSSIHCADTSGADSNFDKLSYQLGCSHNNLASPSAYHCGLRCWGTNHQYTYTFKGVKFAIYGTYEINHGNIIVELNGSQIAEVSDLGARKAYALLYESDIYEYGSHTVHIKQKNNDQYEIYKLAFWPSLRAKRVNSTEFKKSGQWNPETDGIGGIRHWSSKNGGNAAISLNCHKFWIYGVTEPNTYPITLQYNGKVETLEQGVSSTRIEGVLLYESGDLDVTAVSLKLECSNVMILYCIYYEEAPTRVVETIPISVGLQSMEHSSGIENCGNDESNPTFNVDSVNIQNIGCEYEDLNSIAAYRCGLRCWGTMSFTYQFKGVKFQLWGTYDPGFGKTVVKLDGVQVGVIDQDTIRMDYSILYESEVINYKTHTVTIEQQTDKYELYKLVFWPSMRARRFNSTDFQKSDGWNKESDGIGGCREYTSSACTFNKTFSCSRFWLYGSTASHMNGFTISYNGISKTFNENSQKPINGVLIEESDEFDYKQIILRGNTHGYAMLNYLFYHEEPSQFEYIDKTFKRCLPFFHILVTPNSITRQISGCNFINIYENFDYFITLQKEVTFFNNVFEYDLQPKDRMASPIDIKYNGQLTIRNCTFTNVKSPQSSGGHVFQCSSSYTISVNFESCTFTNCGKSSIQPIINIESTGSSLTTNKCTFSFTNPDYSGTAIKADCKTVNVNDCTFYKTGPIHVNGVDRGTSGTTSPREITINGCIFDSCKPKKYSALYINLLETASITFTNNVVQNIVISVDDEYVNSLAFDGNHFIDQLELRNITFSNNVCYSLYGGGCGIVLRDISYVSFYDCKFSNNDAKQSTSIRNIGFSNFGNKDYFNGDGGGIQLGFDCQTKDQAVKFEKCIFKKNRAFRHGGAIAIQTLSTVEIIDCTFESNEAYSNFDSSAEILFENHYHKKSEGRGGAIYINPSYTYLLDGTGCSTGDAYMTSVSIKDCTFTANSAYDGFGIYIEGDDPGTKFEIQNNNFDNNFNFGSSVNSDPLLINRGVIVTEITSLSKIIKTINNFTYDKSHTNPNRLVFVDHYGNVLPTNVFTKSEDFTFSKEFSKSDGFTYSTVFTKSDRFSESQDFSNSKNFTKSQQFAGSNEFSKSQQFSDSNGFSISQNFSASSEFSKSQQFSGSNKFSMSEKFPSSDNFTKSQNFSPSTEFTGSEIFSRSQSFSFSSPFTKSQQFADSNEFSKSQQFSDSNGFSRSQNFPASSEFSKSQQFSGSNKFSMSEKFPSSDNFTKSQNFSPSTEFTSSEIFSGSHSFSASERFSFSSPFTKSQQFADSNEFSKSHNFSDSNKFSKTQQFSDSNKFSKSQQFSDSNKFSKSQQFSDSNKFSKSQQFSDSNKFSKSHKFTDSNKFSKTQQFSGSNEFSRSQKFSDSSKFTKTQQFSNSKGFSKSQQFSGSNEFSQSEKFPISDHFTKSQNFSPSKGFSLSAKFTSTLHFSQSDYFSYSSNDESSLLSLSEPESSVEQSKSESSIEQTESESSIEQTESESSIEQTESESSIEQTESELSIEQAETEPKTSIEQSVSESFIEQSESESSFVQSVTESELKSSEEQSESQTSNAQLEPESSNTESMPSSDTEEESSSIPEIPSQELTCLISVNGVNITLYRCTYISQEPNVFVQVILTNFFNYVNESDGGAIHLVDCGFECKSANFTECYATNGGGGAIYIKNAICLDYNVTIIDSFFLKCKAVYGGAVCIYSSCEQNEVLIQSCQFESNIAERRSINNENPDLFGGSAVFMTARNCNVNASMFHKSKGKGGAFKIYNKFDDEITRKINELDDKSISFSISNCDFENDNKMSSSSIYYIGGKGKADVDIKDCNFKGKISSGSHYIDGKLLFDDASKIQIESCQFESKNEKAINRDLINELMNGKIEIPLSSNLYDHFILKYALIFALFVLGTVFILLKLWFGIKEDNDEIWPESLEQA